MEVSQDVVSDPTDPLSLEHVVNKLKNDPVFVAESILVAAANHDTKTLDDLLKTGSANVRNPESNTTPLHAAVSAFEPAPDSVANGADGEAVPNPENEDDQQRKDRLEATVSLLFLSGAIWNDVNAAGETPGCIAFRLGLAGAYRLIVDAGVRAELLLAAMEEYQQLEGEEVDDDDEGPTDQPVSATDDTATPVEDEQRTTDSPNGDVDSHAYLTSTLRFSADRILDADSNAVMMAWEHDLMRRSAARLAPTPGLRVLNIGAGMSLIDDAFQAAAPAAHHIVEAHPAVLARLRADGWHDKPGVVVHAGRWQDVVPALVAQDRTFDAIYFDTFAEDYAALREFFSEHVIQLLDPAGGRDGEGGAFGFFNGLGADRQVCYDVYTRVVEIHLNDAGLETEWEEVPVPDLDRTGEWAGVKRKYWVPTTYRLPTCRFFR